MSNPPEDEPDMFEQGYEAIVGSFPSNIPFPPVNQRQRTVDPVLGEVRSVDDLPSRFVFGDLVTGSFIGEYGHWSARYSDALSNGIDLSVSGARLEVTSRFLGREVHATGDATSRTALESLRAAARQWDGVLKEYLEARYPIYVGVPDNEDYGVLYMPDGFLRVLLVPVAPSQLPSLFAWYTSLARDGALGAQQDGAVSLLFNAVNYIEERCPAEICDGEQLLMRGLRLCTTPALAEPVREEGSDGSAAWTVRRSAYLFRCTVFMKDMPRVVESLEEAGLLSAAPDLCAAVFPEGIVEVKKIHWWSRDRECRITWAFEPPLIELIEAGDRVDLETTYRLMQQAIDAGTALQKHLGVA